MLKTAVVVVVVTICTPPDAAAQWTLTPFAGVNLGAQHSFVDLDDAAGSVQPTFGGAVGWESSRAWAVEAEVATSPKFLKGDSGVVETGRVDTFFANANWRLRAPASRLRPYVAAGLGAARVTVKDVLGAFTSTSTLAAVNIGGGIIVGTSTRMRLIGDARYVRSRYGDARAAGLGEEYVAYWRATGGVRFRF
jgi:hypothetical protein